MEKLPPKLKWIPKNYSCPWARWASPSLCGESIQLFFNALQWEANRTTSYVVIDHWRCRLGIFWCIAWNLFLTFRLCTIYLVGNSSNKNFFNIKNPTTRCFSPFPFARLYFQFLLCSIFWGKFPSPLLTPLKNNGPSTMNIRRKIYRSSVWNKTQQMFSWRKKGT